MNTSRLLIDSHVFVWIIYEPNRIGPKAHATLTAADTVWLSSASLLELTIKFSRGKKDFPYSPQELLQSALDAGLVRLPIQDSHFLKYIQIQLVHKDPFDRLLVAQSQAEQVPFMTADRNILSSIHDTINATE